MTKTLLPFHNTTTEERIMRTFFPKTVNQQNLFGYFCPISKGRLQQKKISKENNKQ